MSFIRQRGVFTGMSGDKEMAAGIIEAHQDLVSRLERSAGRMRALSAVTVVVALVLSASYVSQLLLPAFGVTSVPVNLSDPGTIVAELIVLAFVLLWLYVGLRDLAYSSRLRKQIAEARGREKELGKNLPRADVET